MRNNDQRTALEELAYNALDDSIRRLVRLTRRFIEDDETACLRPLNELAHHCTGEGEELLLPVTEGVWGERGIERVSALLFRLLVGACWAGLLSSSRDDVPE